MSTNDDPGLENPAKARDAKAVADLVLHRVSSLGLWVPIVAVALALVTSAGLLAATGSNPWSAYRSMFSAALGSPLALSVTINRTIPRLMAALGIALALQAGLWNIGADGQIYLGAVASTAVIFYFPTAPFPVVLVVALIAGALAGAAWGAIPGLLRAWKGTSEVITSLMLVYVATQLMNYLLEGPWVVAGSTYPATNPFPSDTQLPIIWAGTLLNAGVITALLAVAAMWFVSSRSTLGVRLRAMGSSEPAARFAGIRVRMLTVAALAVSGAFAGLGGSVDTIGAEGRLLEGFSGGWGFQAIAIALIGRLQPFGILAAALFFGALDAGSAGLLTSGHGVPSSIVQITESIAVIYVLVALGVTGMLSDRRRARQAIEERPRRGDEATLGAAESVARSEHST